MRPKLLTFKKVLEDLKPSVFFLEETKFKDTGKLKLEEYLVFEKVRKNKVAGGGVALGCIRELKPAWVREGEDPVEAISVEIFVKQMKIRCCVGYGFQENDIIENKNAFWKYMDEEVEEASKTGAGLILQFDGNLWAGNKIIPNDPRPQNRNGKLFEQFLSRHSNLTVVNALDICEGLITRSRIRDGVHEKSVLDFFVVCHLVLPHITRMVIDEEKRHVLTNYEQVRKGGKAADTDHATQYIDLDLKIITDKPKRREIWNFKSKESQDTFRKQTSETKDFSDCFNDELPLMKQIDDWKKLLNSHLNNAFTKVRIKGNGKGKPVSTKISKLIDERNKLIGNNATEIEVENLNDAISNIEAETNRNDIVNQFKSFGSDPENVNLSQVWKLLKKLCPKLAPSLPTAKKDHSGKIISESEELKKLLSKEYKERLRTRPLRPDLKHLDRRRRRIFKMKMKIAEATSSKLWTMSDLDAALRDLKNNKSRDPEGLINEIFKKDIIGDDLKLSLLIMFNKIKQNKMIPVFMNLANITTVPKGGSRLRLEKERGIFRVSVLRYILMRLMYNDKYPIIDNNISDSQMGARKQKGCRNNIFIVNAIIHDVMSSKSKNPVLLQIYDYKQMFDAIHLEQAVSDIFNYGMDDDNLVLLHQANREINMAVNTPNGLSDRKTLENVVLQGDTWGSLMASVQVDSIGKEVEESGFGYMYKDVQSVSLLGLVDDIIGVTEAGYRAQQLNAMLNVKTAEKRLQFGIDKCKSMLVSKNPQSVVNTPLAVDNWKVVHKENPLTGEQDLFETYEGLVEMDKTDEQKYLGFVISSKGNNLVNIKEMKRKSIWIINKIFSKLDSLTLKKYYFECGVIFLNIMLRSSILYASECYYNLKETELRQLERIEEGFLRRLLKTPKGCPISQLYLESGHIPARFHISKMRLLFLKYILGEDPNSLIHKILVLQIENPCRGDWASSCYEDLNYLEIDQSFEDIKKITKKQFTGILNEAIQKRAFNYLLQKRGSKGIEIEYTCLKMADYLLPNDSGLTITEQRYIFAMRNRMISLPLNFSSNVIQCISCDDVENMQHLYSCKKWNNNEEDISYKIVFTDEVRKFRIIYERFKTNHEKRERYTEKENRIDEETGTHVILNGDPLSSMSEYSNGF